MISTANRIEKRIVGWKRGRIFFPSEFAALATDENTRITLMRLKDEGKIVRVATGIYCYPVIDKEYGLGTILPSTLEIAQAVAKHDKIRINPSGPFALNALGLSTQVAANAVFITDGAPRTIKISEKRKIIFKHSSRAKDFAYKSRLMQLIVAAIKEIGDGKLTDSEKAILKKHLTEVPKSQYEHDIQLAPLWVRKMITTL